MASRIRTDLKLASRVRSIPMDAISAARQEFRDDLEQRNIIYPPSLRGLGVHPEMKLHERKQALGLTVVSEELTPEEVKLSEFLEQQGSKIRKSNWTWRVGRECHERDLDGWYPFFVTLTVDPNRVADPEAMWREGREWQKYLRRICNVVTAAMGQGRAHKRGESTAKYVRYAGVLEHGKSREHHHLHAIIWLRAIPESWKVCPNRGIRDPKARTRQRCLPLEALWPHAQAGLKPAKYFRFDGDIWSRLGFAVPVVDGRPLRTRPAEQAGAYVTKYTQKESKEWQHRMKTTAGLGLMNLRGLLRMVGLNLLERLTWRPRQYSLNLSLTMTHSVPLALLRSEAQRMLWFRKWAIRSEDLTSWMQTDCDAYSLMRESVRDGARPYRMGSQERYDWLGQFLPVPSGYCERLLALSHLALRHLFPPGDGQILTRLGGQSNGHTRGV